MNSATGLHLLRQAGSVVAARLPRTWDTSQLLLQSLNKPPALVSRDQRRCSASASHSATTHHDAPSPAEEACLALYFNGTEPQQDFNAGRIAQVPGKGRGLVAGCQLRPGDLVMLARPLSVLHGQQDQMPSPGAFLSHLQSRWPSLSTKQQKQLASMHGATPGSAAAGNEAPSPTSITNSSSATATPGATSNSNSEPPSRQRPTDPRVDLHAVVSYNAYGDEYEDLPAACLRGAVPRSHVGLWPGFSFLNHSCVPNCVQYVVGSTMTVRAVQDVDAGEELTVSYLGREVLAPRHVRQSVLQHRYGFTCSCERCRTEAEELSPELQQLLQELYDRTRTELAPRFERVAEAVAASAAGQGDVGVEGDGDGEDGGGEVEDMGEDAVGAGAAGEGRAVGAATGGASARTAAEVARQRLKEAAAAVAPAGAGAAGAPPSTAAAAAATAAAAAGPRWSRLLSALEPSLEAAARQLHAAIRELQEDDEAEEEATKLQQQMQQQQPSSDPSPQQDRTSAPASPQGPHGRRRLSRVQVAQAASYQLLELLHLHAHLLGAARAGGAGAGGAGGAAAAQAQQALEACWHVLDAACRGSELQVFQACQLLEAAMQQAKASGAGREAARGAGSQQAAAARLQAHEGVREAAALLGQSLAARYGRLKGQHLARLTQASMVAAREFY